MPKEGQALIQSKEEDKKKNYRTVSAAPPSDFLPVESDKEDNYLSLPINNSERDVPSENKSIAVISPISTKEIFKDSLINALTLCGINCAVNINIFVSGTIIKGVSHKTLAAYSLIYSETAALVLLFIAPLTAINVTVSHNIKKNDVSHEEIARTLQAGWLLAGVLTIPSLIISSINKPLLLFLQQESDVAQIVQGYFWVSLAGWLPLYVQFASGQFLSGLKKRLVPLALDLGVLGLSIFLTETFALGKFGAPRLDIKGYGVSLAASNWVNMLGYLAILFFHKDFRQYKLYKKSSSILEELGRLAGMGMPAIIAYLGEAGIIVASSFMAGKLGEEELITQGIFGLYLVLLTVPTISLFESTSVFVSGALGAKQFKDIRRYILANLSLSLVCPSIALALTCTIPKQFMRPFIDPDNPFNKNIVDNLTISLPLLAGGNLLDSARMMFSGSLLGMQDIRVSSLVNALIQLFLIIPLMYALSFHTSLGVNGLMAAYLVGSFILTIYTSIRSYIVSERLLSADQEVNQGLIVQTSERAEADSAPEARASRVHSPFFNLQQNQQQTRDESSQDSQVIHSENEVKVPKSRSKFCCGIM